MTISQAQIQSQLESRLSRPIQDESTIKMLPKETQRQMVEIIKQSHNKLLNLNRRQANIFVEKYTSRTHQYNLFQSQTLLTRQKMNWRTYNSFSIIPIIAGFVYNTISNLIQMEVEIDPVTMKLIQVKDMTVVELVNLLLSTQQIWDQFDQINLIFAEDLLKLEDVQKVMVQALRKITVNLQSISFAIERSIFQEACFNQKCGTVVDLQTAKQVQDQAFQQGNKMNDDFDGTVQLVEYMRFKFVQLLLKKRGEYIKPDKPSFWKLLTNDDIKRFTLPDVLQKEINAQINYLGTNIIYWNKVGQLSYTQTQFDGSATTNYKGNWKKTKLIKKQPPSI